MASPLVFLVVGYAVSPEQGNMSNYELHVFMACLASVYIGGLVASQLLRKNIMRQNLARGVDPIAAFKAAHLVTLAFYESGAIYGLLVALLGGPKSYLLAMVGVCLVMMAKDFPSESRLNERSSVAVRATKPLLLSEGPPTWTSCSLGHFAASAGLRRGLSKLTM